MISRCAGSRPVATMNGVWRLAPSANQSMRAIGTIRQAGNSIGPGRKEVRMWTKPDYTEMRFGFEVTMYIANR